MKQVQYETLKSEFQVESSHRSKVFHEGGLQNANEDFYYFDAGQIGYWSDMTRYVSEKEEDKIPGVSSDLICPHLKVNPVFVSGTKRIRKKVVDDMGGSIGGIQPIGDNLNGVCVECVKYHLIGELFIYKG